LALIWGPETLKINNCPKKLKLWPKIEKKLYQKNGSAGLKGWRDDVIKEYKNMHKHPLIMYTSTENPNSKYRIFIFYCKLHDFTSL